MMARRIVPGRRRRLGFTLPELLVVIALLVVVLSIAVPAFSGMLSSGERSLAENTLRVAMLVAKDEAALGDGDVAVFFLDEPTPDASLDLADRDPPGLKIVVARYVASFEDAAGDFNPYFGGAIRTTTRDVFVGIPTSPPVKLPGDWWVAGLAPPGSMDADWYDDRAYAGAVDAGDLRDVVSQRNWVLPMAGLYDVSRQGNDNLNGPNVAPIDPLETPRASFMIRFESGTGRLVNGGNDAILVDVRPSITGRGGPNIVAPLNAVPPSVLFQNRIDLVTDVAAFVEGFLGANDFNLDGQPDSIDDAFKQAVLGNYSNDTVLARPVSRISLFRMRDLARGLFTRGVNEQTRTIFRPDAYPANGGSVGAFAPRAALDSRFDNDETVGGLWPEPSQQNPSDGNVRVSINAWMEGNTVPQATTSRNLPLDGSLPPDFILAQSGAFQPLRTQPRDVWLAKIFQVQAQTGELVEVER